ncbi:MAG: helix-turn-helix transcriptional regulator [Thalassobaculales bacterium]
MTVAEVAQYLRLRERTVYELTRTGRMPVARIGGKLLFPRQLIERWVAESVDYPGAANHLAAPPPVVAGSHDPLLDWALRESGSGLAVLSGGGSAGGLARLAEGRAVACGLHLIDPATGEYDAAAAITPARGLDLVVIEWARRCQGLVVAPGNPLAIQGIADLGRPGLRIARRQPGSGAAALMERLAAAAGVPLPEAGNTALTESDLAALIRDGVADAGLAIAAVAREAGLGFVPLHWERFDLAIRRVEYFEPPLQALLAFTRQPGFAARAAALTGYDVAGTGRVVLNPRG